MKRKTLKKDTIRLIANSKGRFFSLTAIVGIGVAFFVGVSASSPIMAYSVDQYVDATQMKDIQVYSTYGFNQEDVDAIASLEDVSAAQGTLFVDVTASAGERSMIARVHVFDEDSLMDQVVLEEGRYPENANEILAEYGSGMGRSSLFQIGDVVTFTRPKEDLEDWLNKDQFTVVGLVDTPVYLNETKETSTLSNQYLRTYFYLSREAFVPDYFTEVDVLMKDGTTYNSFSQSYKTYNKDVAQEIEDLGETQVSNRKEEVLSEAYEELADGQKEYDDAYQEFTEKIQDAEKEIADGQQEIRDGQQAIADAIVSLEKAQKELDEQQVSASIQINDARIELSKAESQLKTAEEEYATLKAQYETQLATLRSQQGQLETLINALTSAISTIESLETNINDLNTLESGILTAQGATGLPDSATVLQLITAVPSLADPIHALGIPDTATIGTVHTTITSSIAAANAGITTVVNTINASLGTAYTSKTDLQTALTTAQGQKAMVDSGIQQIVDGLASGQAQIDDARNMIANGWQQATNASVELDQKVEEGQQKINDGYAEIEDKKKDLAQGQIDLEDAKQELADAKEDGEQELADAQADLDKAKQDIADLEDGSWTVLDRTKQYGIATFRDTVDQMRNIAAIFPVFFFLVAALVCLTTMTRMVDEQRGQIGILRALGYTRGQCAMKYLSYAIIATVIGEVVGCIVGLLVFPKIIYEAWKMEYILPAMKMMIPWDIILTSGVAFLGVMILSTWFACKNDMKEVPSQLMRPKSPRLGKSSFIEKISLIWNHVSFTWKVTIRNLIRYKKRFFMTVFGVAGCTALLVTGFGIKDSISTIVERQFNDIIQYNGLVIMEDGTAPSQMKSMEVDLLQRDDVSQVTRAQYYSQTISANNFDETVRTEVYNSEKDFESTYHLFDAKNGKPMTLPEEGLILSEKLAKTLNVSIGDTVTIESTTGVLAQAKVSGICEMYVYHYCFMSESYYEQLFHTQVSGNVLFVVESQTGTDLQKVVSNMAGVSQIEFYDAIIESFDQMIQSLDLIVWVLIISSMSLAFVVLGNLTSVNISERQREIATLKVLGFRKKEVKNYIYKENNILTGLGALLGLPLGVLLHHYVMNQIEMSYVMFGMRISATSFFICFAMTVAFGMLVNLFMSKRLQDITMVESLKSVE